VTFADNRAPLLVNFPHYRDQIHAWEDRWWDMFSGVFEETVQAIEDLHTAGVRQFGLSNMSHEVIDGITAMTPAFQRLGGIVISAETAIMKPDPRIYWQACDRFGFQPADVLFVDDSAANIAGAQTLGFDTHHFTDPAALRPALEARGLL
jgi:HAD superfamily hydrolase (TIGR01549 family)